MCGDNYMKTEERNYYIDFLRFVFSVIIVFYHSWIFASSWGECYFNRGFYAVDFYFIVTGFLLLSSLEKMWQKKQTDSLEVLNLKFIARKIKPLVPNILLVFVIGYFLNYRRSSFLLTNLFSDKTVTEALFAGVLGKGMAINSACWYISVMIVVLFFLFPVVYRYQKKYNYYLCPLIIFLTLGVVNYHQININNPLATTYLFANGFYKGVLFINLGILSYELCSYLKKLELSKQKRILITVFETLTYIALALNTYYALFGSYLTAILFMINISITFSNLSYSARFFRSPRFKQLGKFGFILYLSNIPVRNVVISANLSSYNRRLVLYWILVLGLSLVSYLLSELITKKWYKKKKMTPKMASSK